MDSRKTERVQIVLSKEDRKLLETKAKELDITLSDLIRVAFKSYTANSNTIYDRTITGLEAQRMRLTADFKLEYDGLYYFLFKGKKLVCTSPINMNTPTLYPVFDLSQIEINPELSSEWVIWRYCIFPYLKKDMVVNAEQTQKLLELKPVSQGQIFDDRFDSTVGHVLNRCGVKLVLVTFEDKLSKEKKAYIHSIDVK